MWFSNLICYRFKQDIEFNQEDFEKSLIEDAFRPCGNQDLSSFGWTNALGKSSQLLSHFSNGRILLCAKREEKVLPPAVINDLLAEKVEQIEQAESRPVKKKEKDELKENLIHSLLPQAFKKSSLMFAFIDTKSGWLIVNSASFNKAEELLALLRKSLGSLPVIPAFANYDLSVFLTHWLNKNQIADGFELGLDAELIEPAENGAKVVFKQHDLSADEIRTHLENGKVVSKLGINWQDKLKFLLQEDGSIKRVGYSELLKEENADIPKEELNAKLDADFILVTQELKDMLTDLFVCLGEPDSAL